MSIGIAFRAFFKSLFNQTAAERIAVALDSLDEPARLDPATPSQDSEASSQPSKRGPSKRGPSPHGQSKQGHAAPPASVQNPSITLMATLQREARLIDLIYEDLDQYQDAQVGAAARPCLKQCRVALDRLLKIGRVIDQAENETVELADGQSAGRIQFVGEASGSSQSVKLVHPGWLAQEVTLPKWNGDPQDQNVIAPAQVTRNG